MVVAVEHQVDLVLVEQRDPRRPHATLGGVLVRRRVGAVVEVDDDEVDVRLLTKELQSLAQPGGLGVVAVAAVRGDLVRHVVGVEADVGDVAVDERVDRRAGRGSVAGEGPTGLLAAVSVRRVERFHVVVAGRHHPRDLLGDEFGLSEELVPDPRVVDVRAVGTGRGDRAAGSTRVGVRDVTGVQVELRVLAQQHGVVGECVVTDALVAEGGERIGRCHVRVLAPGCGGELAQSAEVRRVRRVEALVADAVVVGGVREQPAEVDVQVVLVGRPDRARDVGVQVAHLGVDPITEVERVPPDPDERRRHRQRGLPADRHLGTRVGAEGQVAAERDDRPAVDGGPLEDGRGRGDGRGRAGRDGSGSTREERATAQQRATARSQPTQVVVLFGHRQTAHEGVRDTHAGDTRFGHRSIVAGLICRLPPTTGERRLTNPLPGKTG
ncbi:hypothetical protein BH09PAT4_BH09PAT4_09330 [soil metagenome]